jgi:hypothetical protein
MLMKREKIQLKGAKALRAQRIIIRLRVIGKRENAEKMKGFNPARPMAAAKRVWGVGCRVWGFGKDKR